jgi:hypothetical protein
MEKTVGWYGETNYSRNKELVLMNNSLSNLARNQTIDTSGKPRHSNQ